MKPATPVQVRVHDESAAEPLLAHIKVGQQNPRWWLQASSYPIEILDHQRVHVLLSSREMRSRARH